MPRCKTSIRVAMSVLLLSGLSLACTSNGTAKPETVTGFIDLAEAWESYREENPDQMNSDRSRFQAENGKAVRMSVEIVRWHAADARHTFGKQYASRFDVFEFKIMNPTDCDLWLDGAALRNRVRYEVSLDDVKKYIERKEDEDSNAPSDTEAKTQIGQRIHEWIDHSYLINTPPIATFSEPKDFYKVSRDANHLKGTFEGLLLSEGDRLRDIEKIPAKDDIRRIVFYPRGHVFSLFPGVPARISEIQFDEVDSSDLTVTWVEKREDNVSELLELVRAKMKSANKSSSHTENAAQD